MTSSTVRADFTVAVQAGGRVSGAAKDYAAQKVGALHHLISVPVLGARVQLTQSADPALERPAAAAASLDLNGRLLRAHVSAPTMREAIDALEDRLRDQLERLAPDWESMRGRSAIAGLGTRRRHHRAVLRAELPPQPGERRKVVRHKSYSLPRITPDDAIIEMELLDDDFHLFTDLTTGQDSVLYRDTRATYRLAQLHPGAERAFSAEPHLSYSELPAPVLTPEEATERLDLSGFPFVFFTNSQTGRGNLLYHRYDGDYGLITPAD